MHIENKDLTRLVKSMKAALKRDHAVNVPHTALRASLLSALGENPHAFAGKSQASEHPLPAVNSQDIITRKIHLVGDELGILCELSLDREGSFLLEDDDLLVDVTITAIEAEVPSINRYGLPDYLSTPTEFFTQVFGMKVASKLDISTIDMGDDTGDICAVTVEMPVGVWHQIVLSALKSNEGLSAQVGEWVGMHYRRNFAEMSEVSTVEWVERYLEAHT